MEKYKLKEFAKWAAREGISDQALVEVLSEMERGLLGDRLGAHVYKKRIPVPGRGKRGGGRAIILFRDRDVSLFLYGYLKGDIDNISPNEERQLRLFAGDFLKLPRGARSQLCAQGKLIAVKE